ncbi:tetratricopeptide repeat protein [Candidatus Sumerlaeota bacterium]|nr:tetratricopeptide repeat protein [Candidatus Sumerlaeota bacterium]
MNTYEEHYWPLVYTIFWFERALWGANPAGYHTVNIFLHALNSVLVYLIMRRLAARIALLSALIFALHPIHVESVAWVIERKDVLSGFFYFASILFFLDSDPGPVGGKGARIRLVLSLLCYILGMLSKSIVVTLPAGLFLILRWQRARPSRLIALAWFLLLGAAMASADMYFVRASAARMVSHPFHFSLLDRLSIAARSLWFYAAKIFLPVNNALFYPRWDLNSQIPFNLILIGGALALMIILAKRGLASRSGPEVSAIFFGMTLLPVVGLVDFSFMRHSFVADRFAYLASLGPILLGISLLHGRNSPVLAPSLTGALGLFVCILLAALTFRQSGLYASPEFLYRHTIRINPGAVAARFNLANTLAANNQTAEAIQQYLEAGKSDPADPAIPTNLGTLYAKQGQYDAAIENFRNALALDDHHLTARYNLALALLAVGKLDDGIAELERVLASAPDHKGAMINLKKAMELKARR